MTEYVILVDEQGKQVGSREKLQAHKEGLLHLAFSLVILRNNDGVTEHLLHRRAKNKYHSGGQWSNACCSHPRIDEPLELAVARRAYEELGVVQTLSTQYLGAMTYKANLSNGLIEHEFDHIFVHLVDDEPLTLSPNPQEVSETRWVSEQEIESALANSPKLFTTWFSQLFEHVKNTKNLRGH